jgi:Protein of unknown function (DUF1579)
MEEQMRTRKIFLFWVFGAVCTVLSHGSARAQAPVAPVPSAKPTGAFEMKALEPIFGDVEMEWKGKVEAGAMGPDSKETHSQGRSISERILDHRWSVCELEEKYGEGKTATTWKGHMVVGFDTMAMTYKAVLVDNAGNMTLFDGRFDGKKFVLETPTAIQMMGQPTKDRLTWDLTDTHNIRFTDEHQLAGGAWTLAESGTMKMTIPVAKGTGLHVTK